MFIIKRTDSKGGYVAPDGYCSSYVKDVAKAKRFINREEANRERCVGNEVVLDLRIVVGV